MAQWFVEKKKKKAPRDNLKLMISIKSLITQDIKITCENNIIKGPGAKSVDGHPWRNWKITLIAMDDGKEVKGKLSTILDHVEYILHPTFEEPRRGG